MDKKKKEAALPKVSKTIKDLPPSPKAEAKVKGGAARGEAMADSKIDILL